MAGAFCFCAKESLGMLAAALILLAISPSSFLLIWDNIVKKISKWLVNGGRVIFTKSGK